MKDFFYLCMISPCNNFVQILQMLQCRPIYPSMQPRGQNPLTWSHRSLFIQCPMHRSFQSCPKYPEIHST